MAMNGRQQMVIGGKLEASFTEIIIYRLEVLVSLVEFMLIDMVKSFVCTEVMIGVPLFCSFEQV